MAIGFKDDACQTNETHSRSQVHSTGQFDSSLIPRDETALAAQILFHDFYRCAFINQGVVLRDDPLPDQRKLQKIPTSRSENDIFCSQNDEFAMQIMASVGQDLRRIAEQIEASRERDIIRQRAENVSIKINTYDRFSEILRQLFPNGQITREAIVVLFFFCTDVAFRAYTTGPIAQFHQLVGWSLRFIYLNVCDWVSAQGGWQKVLSGLVQNTAVTVCALLGSVAFAMYIKRNLL